MRTSFSPGTRCQSRFNGLTVMADDQHKKPENARDAANGELPDGTRMSVRFRHYLDQSFLEQAQTNRLLKDIRIALWTIAFVMVIGLNLLLPSCINGL
jgi:hypothetical protein